MTPPLPSEEAEKLLPCPRIYLDCDGVLADFDSAFLAKFGHAPHDYEAANGSEVFWRDIKTEAPTFYRDLPLMPDARELFDAVKHLRPIILTGCPRGGWAEMQKLAWAAEHFPGTPMVVCFARDKCKYLMPGDILIDDRVQYRDKWEQAGGVFIHHTSAEDSLRKLSTSLAGYNSRPSPDMPAASGEEIGEKPKLPDWVNEVIDDINESHLRWMDRDTEEKTLDAATLDAGLWHKHAWSLVEKIRQLNAKIAHAKSILESTR